MSKRRVAGSLLAFSVPTAWLLATAPFAPTAAQATEIDGTPNGQLREAGLFPDKRGENLDRWKLASPAYHVSKDSPPTRILHGTADPTVDRDQSCELGKTLNAAGVPHRLIMLQGVGHTFALLDKGVDVRVVVTFFNTYLKPAK
jgi:dipeptidyl aminopeptidase/acylaminoacyl peptidase